MNDRRRLVLEIAPDSLRAMCEHGVRTVVARHGSSNPAGVAWLAWDPSPRDTIEWDELYCLYAADSVRHEGDVLKIRSVIGAASDRTLYAFHNGLFGIMPAPGLLPRGHYDVRNDEPAAVMLGLLQSATINGCSHTGPVNAVSVPPGFTADFAPPDTLAVWMQPGVKTGSIVTVPRHATSVNVDVAKHIVIFRYDQSSGAFIPASGGEGDHSELPRPPPQPSGMDVSDRPHHSHRTKVRYASLECSRKDRTGRPGIPRLLRRGVYPDDPRGHRPQRAGP